LGLAFATLFAIFAVSRLSEPANKHIEQISQQRHTEENGQAVERPRSWLETYAPPRDSLAQWIAALAAIGSVGVSIWAIGLVRATLRETQKTTRAANEANDILRAEQRPWMLFFEQVSWAKVSKEETQWQPGWEGYQRNLAFAYGVRGAIPFKNYGKTPAFNVGFDVIAAFQQVGLPIPSPRWDDKKLHRDMNALVAPGSYQSSEFTIDAFNLGQLSRNAIDAYWFIRIGYSRGKNKPEISGTDFCETTYGFKVVFRGELEPTKDHEAQPVILLLDIHGRSSAT
jgi:hypothetical protein